MKIVLIAIFFVVRAVLESLNVLFSAIGRGPFFDVSRFEWIPPIESDWKLIQAELLKLLETREHIPPIQEILPAQRVLSNTPDWKTYMLFFTGHRIEQHCLECPETARLLEHIPGLQTAFFSILMPRKNLAPHRGVYNG